MMQDATLLQREPVRIATALISFLMAVTSVLTLGGVISERVSGIITGILAALTVFVGEAFVRPGTTWYRPSNPLIAPVEKP